MRARGQSLVFEKGEWANIQKLVADRVAYYDERVAENHPHIGLEQASQRRQQSLLARG